MNWLNKLKKQVETKQVMPETGDRASLAAGAPTPEPPPPQTPSPETPDAYQELIEWFTTAELPSEPFDLDQARRVTNPVLFYGGLRREIENRQTSPRRRCKATQADLRCLKAVAKDGGNMTNQEDAYGIE